jgi:hypothetical protein
MNESKMFALGGNRTRGPLRSMRVFPPLRQIGGQKVFRGLPDSSASYSRYVIFFVHTYIYIESPNTNRHDHAHKCLHYAGIEPATSCLVSEYSHHYAKSALKKYSAVYPTPQQVTVDIAPSIEETPNSK